MKTIESLDALLKEAVNLGATDLHLSVGTNPRYRLYGKIESLSYPVLDERTAESLIFPLIDTKQRVDLNDTGQIDTSYTLHGVSRFRVNIFRQKGALAAVFRALPNKIPEYTKLGLPISLFNLHTKRRGLILIVGPTGSGKTTTLASFLNIINTNSYKHIVTLEDPIEYVHWHSRSIINQREIGTDCISFSEGLRSALREDPDVILIGEMRDLETTEIALTSAETGHLVCSTLHTLGAAETIHRVVDMYPERQQNQIRSQLASILEAVVSQQLMPKKDGTGYVVAYEIMYKNKEIKRMIQENSIDEINNYLKSDVAMSEGMCTMDSVINGLYLRGVISRDVALDFAFDRKELAKKI